MDDRHIDFKRELAEMDEADEASIERYGQYLEGMSFREVLELGIYSPKAWEREQRARRSGKMAYGGVEYKGGAGNLVEERYFGYDENPDPRPDFPKAGVEVKTSCYDLRKDGEPTAGERVSVAMIPLDCDIDAEFETSHFWEKARRILLVYYQRDKTVDRYDQRFSYVTLFTPPEADLQVIRDDYEAIVRLVRAGRADELSEGMTTYLGAATKGASEAKSWVTQHYPRVCDDGTLEYRPAKRRAFALKRQYMDFVLHNYVIPARAQPKRRTEPVWGSEAVSIEGEAGVVTSILRHPLRAGESFEDRVRAVVEPYVGKSDQELCERFSAQGDGPELAYDPTNKSMWVKLLRRILGVTGNHVEEFRKANISARAIRVEESGRIRESLSFPPFEFEELLAEPDWYSSELFRLLDETRFFFMVFRSPGNIITWTPVDSGVCPSTTSRLVRGLAGSRRGACFARGSSSSRSAGGTGRLPVRARVGCATATTCRGSLTMPCSMSGLTRAGVPIALRTAPRWVTSGAMPRGFPTVAT